MMHLWYWRDESAWPDYSQLRIKAGKNIASGLQICGYMESIYSIKLKFYKIINWIVCMDAKKKAIR